MCRADTRVSSAAHEDDFRNIGKRLDVFHRGGLMEQAGLGGLGRLVPRLAPVAFDGSEQRGLLSADVSARAAPQLQVKAKAASEDVIAEQAAGAGGCDRAGEPPRCRRVLAANVDVALLSAGGQGADGHAFQNGERIALHQDAILERARFGLIGVADDVMSAARTACLQQRLPLLARRESSAATAQQPRLDDLADYAFRSQIDGLSQRFVATGAPIVIEARWIHIPDAAQQAQLWS